MLKLFGTDGVRGIVNSTLMPELAYQLGRAAGAYFCQKEGESRFLIGRDTRISGTMLEAALAAGLSVPQDMVGRDDFEIFPQAVAQKYYEADMQLLRTGESLACESELLPGRQGKRHWTQIWKYPIRDAEGRICGIYGKLTTKISERSNVYFYQTCRKIDSRYRCTTVKSAHTNGNNIFGQGKGGK